MNNYKIVYYLDEKGASPFQSWYERLGEQTLRLREGTGMNTRIQKVDQLPKNTAPVQNLLRARIQRDPAFAGELLKEAVECLLKNEVVPAQLLLRDITNCTIGFQSLARETGIMEKSLMRMLSVKGNPQAKNIFHVIEVLQRLNELKLEVRAV